MCRNAGMRKCCLANEQRINVAGDCEMNRVGSEFAEQVQTLLRGVKPAATTSGFYIDAIVNAGQSNHAD